MTTPRIASPVATRPALAAILFLGIYASPAAAAGRSGSDAPSRAPSRLFYSPTASPAGPGSWTVGVHELFLLFLEAGLTDRLTVSGGTSSIPGSDRQYYYCTAKFTAHSTADLDAGAGMNCYGNRGGSGTLLAFCGATVRHGSGDYAVGLGWSFPRDGRPAGPALSVGASVGIGDGICLITDNRVSRTAGPSILSAGVSITRNRVTAEIGALGALSGAGPPLSLFPWLSFAYAL